ncbi:MAG: type II toxin-antitoxin system PemK/MazF family toxin [Armatimonadetes bacterium]|nr:type II toxin-antitoxin system PemK/MazF family toxin [Armatimonadota bacterium]
MTEFDPSMGTEIRKTRPALIVSNDIANSKGSKVTVVPLTGNIKRIPIVVIVEPDKNNCLDRQSLVRIPDICTFDKVRLKNKIGTFKTEYMKEVDMKLKIHLALI